MRGIDENRPGQGAYNVGEGGDHLDEKVLGGRVELFLQNEEVSCRSLYEPFLLLDKS